MAVIVKKAEKVQATCESLQPGFTFEQFLAAFQEQYPKEWAKVVREYAKHERRTKPGKSHPMPHPEQYMRNALNALNALNAHLSMDQKKNMRSFEIKPSNSGDVLVVVLKDGNTVFAEHEFPCDQADDDDANVRDDAVRECESIGNTWVATGKDPFDASLFQS